MSCEKPKKPLSCAQMLSQALTAYHNILAGAQERIAVRHGESEVRYSQRNVSALKEYIQGLHMSCGNSQSAAVLGIPGRRSPALATFGRQSFDQGCGCNAPVINTCKDDCNECD